MLGMDALGQVLAAGGALGMTLVIILGFIFFLALPVAAIIDCAASRIQGGAKAFIIVVLLLTWGAFSLIYCLFFAQARWLRKATLVVTLIGLLAVIGSCAAFFKGSHILQQKKETRDAMEHQRLIGAFNPTTIESADVEPFEALHVVSTNAGSLHTALTAFTLNGPAPDKGLAVDSKIRDIAITPDRCYAITDHAVGTLSRDSGQFVPVDLKEVFPGFGWPAGITYNTQSRQVVVLTSHVYNRFYTCSPASDEWTQLKQEHREQALTGLAYDGKRKALFAIVDPQREAKVSRLARFDPDGSLVGYVDLRPKIPIARDKSCPPLQIHAASGHLVLLVPHHAEDRIAVYAIDPDTGDVKQGRK